MKVAVHCSALSTSDQPGPSICFSLLENITLFAVVTLKPKQGGIKQTSKWNGPCENKKTCCNDLSGSPLGGVCRVGGVQNIRLDSAWQTIVYRLATLACQLGYRFRPCQCMIPHSGGLFFGTKQKPLILGGGGGSMKKAAPILVRKRGPDMSARLRAVLQTKTR